MADSIFDFVANEIERRTELETLEARGTLRLALKEAGLDPRSVTGEQMGVTLERVLPSELRSRGVDQPEQVCGAILVALKSAHPACEGAEAESPEAIFRRLAQG